MIYELYKHGFDIVLDSQEKTLFGYFIRVVQTNQYNEKIKNMKDLLSSDKDSDYFKIANNEYVAYIFYKDFIDTNEKLYNFFMNIVSYLTKNYSSDNCTKLKDFFQDETGYFLIIDEAQKMANFPKKISDPEILKKCFIQINEELERRHKFGIYDSLFEAHDLHFTYINGEFKVIFLFKTFLGQLDFRYRGTITYIYKDLKEKKILDPELSEKLYKLDEIKDPKNYEKEFENIAYNTNEKNELYNIGKIMLSFVNKCDIQEEVNKIEDGELKKILLSLINKKDDKVDSQGDDGKIEDTYLYNLLSNYIPIKLDKDTQEDVEKIKDDNLKNLITSLIKQKADERITWDEYINHPFFKDKTNQNLSNSYKYEIVKNIKHNYEGIQKIIVLKDNNIIYRQNNNGSIYIIRKGDNKGRFLLGVKGRFLFNINELILIDDQNEKKIYLYKLTDKLSLEKIQTIDIDYSYILPLSNKNKDLMISTKNKSIVLFKNDNSKYTQTLTINLDKTVELLTEIESNHRFAVCCPMKDSGDVIDFYSFEKNENFIKKSTIENLNEVNQMIMLNNRVLAIRDVSNILKLVDVNTYAIFKKILIETRYYNMGINKFGRIMISVLYAMDDISYNSFMKEYSFENGNLIRKKTIKNIFLTCFAESENGLIFVGTENGNITIFN